MLSVVGIFRSLQDASQAVARLRAIPVPADNINVLSPGPADQEQRELAQVPLSEAEQPGLGGGLGAVVGGALGLAGGMFAGTAIASLFIPGVGPIVAIGLAAAGILARAEPSSAPRRAARWKRNPLVDCRRTNCSFTKMR